MLSLQEVVRSTVCWIERTKVQNEEGLKSLQTSSGKKDFEKATQL